MSIPCHDHELIGYSVDCVARSLKFRGRNPWPRSSVWEIFIEGVEAYELIGDAFGNIIFSFNEVSLEEYFRNSLHTLRDRARISGASGSWATDEKTALDYARRNTLKAYALESSIGLSGWVLARKLSFRDLGTGASA